MADFYIIVLVLLLVLINGTAAYGFYGYSKFTNYKYDRQYDKGHYPFHRNQYDYFSDGNKFGGPDPGKTYYSSTYSSNYPVPSEKEYPETFYVHDGFRAGPIIYGGFRPSSVGDHFKKSTYKTHFTRTTPSNYPDSNAKYYT